VIENALSQWGLPADAFPGWLRDAYVSALSDPPHIHVICEEYRAAASIDRDHDEADRTAGRRIACPLLALWSDRGGLATWYEEAGGPLGLWRHWAEDVDGQAMSGGHFFPEEQPEVTATLLRAFLHRK
jgi:haloacetate dehalogenase